MLVENYKFGIGKEVDSDKPYYLPQYPPFKHVQMIIFYLIENRLVEQRKIMSPQDGAYGYNPIYGSGWSK